MLARGELGAGRGPELGHVACTSVTCTFWPRLSQPPLDGLGLERARGTGGGGRG